MIPKPIFSLAILALAFFLSGCGGSSLPRKQANKGPLLPMGHEQILPSLDSGDVKSAMYAYFEQVNAPTFSQYDFVRIDLNGDHLKEALVYVTIPYGRWCDTRGCSLIILRAHLNGFSLIGRFEGVRTPFYVSKKTSGGWHDIAFESNGQLYEEAGTYILRFDGKGYSRPLEPPYVFSRELAKTILLP